jgi:hypothetical protein
MAIKHAATGDMVKCFIGITGCKIEVYDSINEFIIYLLSDPADNKINTHSHK